MKYDLPAALAGASNSRVIKAIDNVIAAYCLMLAGLCYLFTRRRGGGMADAADLKSVDRKVVWVRLPPSAPNMTVQLV